MKIYLLNIDYYYENIEENDYETEVYLSLERAVAEGKYFLSKRSKDIGFRDYNFTVTETEPEYAEKFNADELNINRFNKEDFGMYEPTHIVYNYDIEGILQNKYLEYRDNQRKHQAGFTLFPEDETELAGQRFKNGDIVKIKERNMEEYYHNAYMNYWNKDKLYVVRWLPRRTDGQKYFENTYALISNYNEDEYTKGLFTSEHYERDIELYDEKIDENSPIGFLQKIIKNEIAVSKDSWTKLKIGQVLLDEAVSMEEELFLRSTISPRESKLKTNIYLMYDGINSIWAPEPKVKVQLENATIFTILLEPKVKPLNAEQYNKLELENKAIVDNSINYIKNNIDIILSYWNGEFEEYDLHKILKIKEQ